MKSFYLESLSWFWSFGQSIWLKKVGRSLIYGSKEHQTSSRDSSWPWKSIFYNWKLPIFGSRLIKASSFLKFTSPTPKLTLSLEVKGLLTQSFQVVSQRFIGRIPRFWATQKVPFCKYECCWLRCRQPKCRPPRCKKPSTLLQGSRWLLQTLSYTPWELRTNLLISIVGKPDLLSVEIEVSEAVRDDLAAPLSSLVRFLYCKLQTLTQFS